jgi:hypothetical protein
MATLRRDFDVPNGRATCEGSNATWNLGSGSAFTPGPRRKTTEILDRVGRSQDLPDANWLLASCPALKTRTLTLVPIWVLLYLKNVCMFVFEDFKIILCAYLGWHQRVVHNICRQDTCTYMRTYIYICDYLSIGGIKYVLTLYMFVTIFLWVTSVFNFCVMLLFIRSPAQLINTVKCVWYSFLLYVPATCLHLEGS